MTERRPSAVPARQQPSGARWWKRHPEALRSPEHQVFQFMQTETCTAWPDSSRTEATLYLWIPEHCRKLRGLLILCTNVPEQMLAGHRAIREVCSDQDLGIVWAVPSFMNFRKSTTRDNRTLNMALAHDTSVGFLQQLLNGLAQTSGYAEVATVPWLPIGESGHLLMVDALLEHSPERCLAGVYLKNNHLPPHNRQVPTLVVFGTAQEWGQDKVDIRTRWNSVGDAYQTIRTQRRLNPTWPLSYVIDGTSGHFDCSERLVHYLARYIQAIASTRLSNQIPSGLKPIDIQTGFVNELPVPPYGFQPVKRFQLSDTTNWSSPWYVDKALALEARSIAAINWQADTQLPGIRDDSGHVAPFVFNGIAKMAPSITASDGISFRLEAMMHDRIPANFVGAGEVLPTSSTAPALEWVSGQYKPISPGLFQIALDRSWPYTANYIGVRQQADTYRRAVFQPVSLVLPHHNKGIDQEITFNKLQDIKAGTTSLALKATSSAGLAVSFFVVVGPAIIEKDKLLLTKIPPNSRYPIRVTVAAWQWGRSKEPAIKRAEIVRQTFLIHRYYLIPRFFPTIPFIESNHKLYLAH